MSTSAIVYIFDPQMLQMLSRFFPSQSPVRFPPFLRFTIALIRTIDIVSLNEIIIFDLRRVSTMADNFHILFTRFCTGQSAADWLVQFVLRRIPKLDLPFRRCFHIFTELRDYTATRRHKIDKEAFDVHTGCVVLSMINSDAVDRANVRSMIKQIYIYIN